MSPEMAPMFSIGKVLMLAALIGAVLTAYRWLRRVEKLRERAARTAVQPRLVTEEMIKCKVCGVYVPARGARNCGYADCPFGS